MKLLISSLLFLISSSFANDCDSLQKPTIEIIWIKMEVEGHDQFYMSHPKCGDLIQIKHLPTCICTRTSQEIMDEVICELLEKHPEYKTDP